MTLSICQPQNRFPPSLSSEKKASRRHAEADPEIVGVAGRADYRDADHLRGAAGGRQRSREVPAVVVADRGGVVRVDLEPRQTLGRHLDPVGIEAGFDRVAMEEAQRVRRTGGPGIAFFEALRPAVAVAAGLLPAAVLGIEEQVGTDPQRPAARPADRVRRRRRRWRAASLDARTPVLAQRSRSCRHSASARSRPGSDRRGSCDPRRSSRRHTRCRRVSHQGRSPERRSGRESPSPTRHA